MTLIDITLLAAIAIALAIPTTATADCDVPLADGVCIDERASNPAQKYDTNGANLYLQTGAIVGPRDVELGTYIPGIPSLLNGDVGAHGILNLGADITDMVRVQNGQHRDVLATRRYGIRINGQLHICGPACVDVGRALDRATRHIRRLDRRIARLERRP